MPVRKKKVAPRSREQVAPEELLLHLPGSHRMTYEAGERIFAENSAAHCCFLVTRGRVTIVKRTKKTQAEVARVKAGEFLGEMAMLSHKKRSASAYAQTRVEAIVIPQKEFEAMLQHQHPFAGRLSLYLSTLLASRCQRMLKILANQPELVTRAGQKADSIDVRTVLNRVYTMWAV